MFTKTPVSMLLIVWMAGIILFFNMFLGPFTKQLQTVKDINTQINTASQQDTNQSTVLPDTEITYLVDYSPLAVFNSIFNK